MIKNFLLNNVNDFNENDINCIIEQLNEKLMKIYIECNLCECYEQIENIDMIMFYDKNAYENNVYIQFNITYFNYYCKKIMHESKYCLINCKCDVCDIDNYIIFERYIDLLIKTKTCELCKIENINFNLIK